MCKKPEEYVNSVIDTAQAIIKNPLPTIETIALVAVGVPPPVASAAVTALNGGNIQDVAAAAAGSYVGGQVASYASSELAAAGPTQGAYIPSDTNNLLVKVGASAAGADVGATTAALASGKNFGDALKIGTDAAVKNLAGSAGSAVGTEVASNVDDPMLSKIAGEAAKAGTTTALTGGNIGSEITKAAGEDVLNAAGDVIGKNLPSGPNIDLSGVKETIKPISDVATKIAQPISDVATKVLQPAEGAIKGAAQTASDVVTSATEPLRQGFQNASDAVTSATKPVGDALSSVGDTIKDIPADNLDKSIINLMGQAPTAATLGQPAASNVATGGEGSAAAYGDADVAMLGDTSQAGLGSKVSKKGGKYPWGEPEGTTALKEGLGV